MSAIKYFKVECGKCGQHIEGDMEGFERLIQCPTCSAYVMVRPTVQIQLGTPEPQPTPPASTAPLNPTQKALEIDMQVEALQFDRKREKILDGLSVVIVIGCVLGVLCLIIAWIMNSTLRSDWKDEVGHEAYLKAENRTVPLGVAGLCFVVVPIIALNIVKWGYRREATPIEVRRRQEEFYRQRDKEMEFQRRICENPFQCPKCESLEVVTYHPSKPMVFTPLSFTGILLGGAANAMADRIFKSEQVCQKCGCRWPAPGE